MQERVCQCGIELQAYWGHDGDLIPASEAYPAPSGTRRFWFAATHEDLETAIKGWVRPAHDVYIPTSAERPVKGMCRGGRRPKPPTTALTARMEILLHPDLLADVDAAAADAHQDRSEWVRDALIWAIRQQRAGRATETEARWQSARDA